ncbi:MAG: helix-turn-helix domain-containing protein [Butyrivibrio sp.]|nr:helix-turn-helix domain-containing protein [Butyrivibrio sp.]MBO6240527.1 helix-turn-helix domain-containing protein [Butyrivibrio sp.]MCR5338002.1 helix-turn-helix domain-containing protein [Lachnospiraceae bacterium]
MDMNLQENYINLEEAAVYLGIKPATLRSWIKDPDNEVPAHKVGRMWKFKRSEIDEWINSGKSAIV